MNDSNTTSKTQRTEFKGKVRAIGMNDNKKDALFIKIENDDGEITGQLPITEIGDLGLDAIRMALSGQQVRYTRSSTHFVETQTDFGTTTEYRLEVLSGPLNGQIYEESRFL